MTKIEQLFDIVDIQERTWKNNCNENLMKIN